MKTAKLFKNGRSQAVRLPMEFRFEGDEVYIKKTPQGVLLVGKKPSLKAIWEETLWADSGSFDIERNQPDTQQQRKELDDLFA